LTRNPVSGVKFLQEQKRTRSLADMELTHLWQFLAPEHWTLVELAIETGYDERNNSACGGIVWTWRMASSPSHAEGRPDQQCRRERLRTVDAPIARFVPPVSVGLPEVQASVAAPKSPELRQQRLQSRPPPYSSESKNHGRRGSRERQGDPGASGYSDHHAILALTPSPSQTGCQ
jgi:hypothetical protein